MPPKLLIDLDAIDLNAVEIPVEQIRECNPQRYEMEQLTAIVKFDPERRFVIARRDVKDDEFWVRGHIPGRPLMPGVLICEAAAQACSYCFKRCIPGDHFLGFGGMEAVKFRRSVLPGDRLIIIAQNTDIKTRRAVFRTQGVVDGKLVFEAVIFGMVI